MLSRNKWYIAGVVVAIIILILLLRQCGPGVPGTGAQATSTDGTDKPATDPITDNPTGGATKAGEPKTSAPAKPTNLLVQLRPAYTPTGAGLQTVYLNCRNSVYIAVNGAPGNSSVRATGGTVAPAGKAGYYTLTPTAPNVTVEVQANGQWTAAQPLRAIEPPNPEVSLEADGMPVLDEETTVTPRSRVFFRVTPSAELQRLSPQDARYQIDQVMVRPSRGLGAPQVYRPAAGDLGKPTLPIRFTKDFIDALQDGEKVWVQIDGLSRINYQGAKVPVAMDQGAMSFKLTMRK
jgi:hypothetical protein